MKSKKKIAFIISSLTSGGAERVMATLANNCQRNPNIEVHLIILTNGEIYYQLNKSIKVYQPSFDYTKFNRLVFTFKIFFYLRNTLKIIKPNASLSFGGKYNSFVLLSSIGLGINTFISERSQPGISYGFLLNIINPYIYRLSRGIIAQTKKAEKEIFIKTKHKTIKVIGNPIKEFPISKIQKKKVILNVGRFIRTKHQDWLVDYFNTIETKGWELWFVGQGPLLESVIKKAEKSPKKDTIKFFGNQKNIENYYLQASIFAFTSTSEGFPNALGEALRLGCACISFDCDAGPSDLIQHGKNGILIPNGLHEEYKRGLNQLMNESSLRETFSKEGIESIKAFDEDKITNDFIVFIDENSN